MSVKRIQQYFSGLVDKALKSIKVPGVLTAPEGLQWHSVNHGPCATIHATYHSTSVGDMSLDIDIAPTFDLPPPHYLPPVLISKNLPRLSDGKNPLQSKISEELQRELKIMVVPFAFDEITKNSDSLTWSYKYSETWRVSFNSLEKFFFSLYEINSVEKQLYRILKTMKESFIQKSSDLEKKAGTSEMKFEEPPSTALTSVTAEPVGVLSSWSVQPIGNWREESNDDSEDELDDNIDDDQSPSSQRFQNEEVLYDRSSSPAVSSQNYQVLYERSSTSSHSDVDDEPKEGIRNSKIFKSRFLDNTSSVDSERDSFKTPPDDVLMFNPAQAYRDSKPLIKTYYIKMILFSMKLLLADQKIWARENLPSLVLFVLKTFFFVYSSKQRRFSNFWFQEMIEPVARKSVGLEILQSLQDILEGLEEKIKD
jgi:hypothetical protein